MKLIIIFIVCFVHTVPLKCQDFRDVNWGDSKEKIIEKEINKVTEYKNQISCMESILMPQDAYLMYKFFKNKLVWSKYLFMKHKTDNYFEEFLKVNRFLIEKYGDYKTIKTENKSLYKKIIKYYSRPNDNSVVCFFTKTTVIIHFIEHDNPILHWIIYCDKKKLDIMLNWGNNIILDKL